jgi:hypothetical protein
MQSTKVCAAATRPRQPSVGVDPRRRVVERKNTVTIHRRDYVELVPGATVDVTVAAKGKAAR